jgi:membrane-associated HD superfamily phosphohydrolase
LDNHLEIGSLPPWQSEKVGLGLVASLALLFMYQEEFKKQKKKKKKKKKEIFVLYSLKIKITFMCGNITVQRVPKARHSRSIGVALVIMNLNGLSLFNGLFTSIIIIICTLTFSSVMAHSEAGLCILSVFHFG